MRERRNLKPMKLRERPVNRYNLYVKTTEDWELQFQIDADSHNEAFRLAMFLLEPRHYKDPIRLEQEVAPLVH